MQLKTILNRVQKFKSFVYKLVRWVGNEAAPELEVEVAERANGARAAATIAQAMIDWRSADSSLFRCGGSRCFWCMPHAGSNAPAAGFAWNKCPGPGGNGH